MNVFIIAKRSITHEIGQPLLHGSFPTESQDTLVGVLGTRFNEEFFYGTDFIKFFQILKCKNFVISSQHKGTLKIVIYRL